MAVREVERAVNQRQLTSGQRARFQAAALLARAERANVRGDEALTPTQKESQLKRLEGLATILAQIATREPSLFSLLQDDAVISDATRRLEREMQLQAGLEPEPEPEPSTPRSPASYASGPRCRSPSSRPSWPTRSWCPTSPRPHRGCTGAWPGGS